MMYTISKDQLIVFFQQYAPDKISNVTDILTHFTSDEILTMTAHKYNATPTYTIIQKEQGDATTLQKAAGSLCTPENLNSNSVSGEINQTASNRLQDIRAKHRLRLQNKIGVPPLILTSPTTQTNNNSTSNNNNNYNYEKGSATGGASKFASSSKLNDSDSETNSINSIPSATNMRNQSFQTTAGWTPSRHMNRLDQNNDGQISIFEFQNWMNKIIQRRQELRKNTAKELDRHAIQSCFGRTCCSTCEFLWGTFGTFQN